MSLSGRSSVSSVTPLVGDKTAAVENVARGLFFALSN